MRLKDEDKIIISSILSVFILMGLLMFLSSEEESAGKDSPLSGEVDAVFEKFTVESFIEYLGGVGIGYPSITFLREFECLVNPDGSIENSRLIFEGDAFPGYVLVATYSKENGFSKIENIKKEDFLVTRGSGVNYNPRVYTSAFKNALDLFLSSSEGLRKMGEDTRSLRYSLISYPSVERLEEASRSKYISVYVLNRGKYLPFSEKSQSGLVFFAEDRGW